MNGNNQNSNQGGSGQKPFNRAEYEKYVEQLAQKYGVPASVWRGVVQQESSWDLKARSPKNASGLWQIMPATAKALGVDPTDPYQAADGGLRLLAENYKRFRPRAKNEKHAWMMAVAGYHGNPANVDKDLDRGGYGLPRISDGSITTRDHVLKIFGKIDANSLDRIPGKAPAPGSFMGQNPLENAPELPQVSMPQIPTDMTAPEARTPVKPPTFAETGGVPFSPPVFSTGMSPVAPPQVDQFGNVTQERMGAAPVNDLSPQGSKVNLQSGMQYMPGGSIGKTERQFTSQISGPTDGRGVYDFQRTGTMGDLLYVGQADGAFLFKGKGPEDYYEARETEPGRLAAPRPKGDAFVYLGEGEDQQRFTRVGEGLFKSDYNGQVMRRGEDGTSFTPEGMPDWIEDPYATPSLDPNAPRPRMTKVADVASPEFGWEPFRDESNQTFFINRDGTIVKQDEWKAFTERRTWKASLPADFQGKTARTVKFDDPLMEQSYIKFFGKYGLEDTEELAQYFIKTNGVIAPEIVSRLVRPTYTIDHKKVSTALSRAPERQQAGLPNGWFRYVGPNGADYVTDGEDFIAYRTWNNTLSPLAAQLPRWYGAKQTGEFQIQLPEGKTQQYADWRNALGIANDNDDARRLFIQVGGMLGRTELAEVTVRADEAAAEEVVIEPPAGMVATDEDAKKAREQVDAMARYMEARGSAVTRQVRVTGGQMPVGEGVRLPADDLLNVNVGTRRVTGEMNNITSQLQSLLVLINRPGIGDEQRASVQASINQLNAQREEAGLAPLTYEGDTGLNLDNFLRQNAYSYQFAADRDYGATTEDQNAAALFGLQAGARIHGMTPEQIQAAANIGWTLRGSYGVVRAGEGVPENVGDAETRAAAYALRTGQSATMNLTYGALNAALGGTPENPHPLILERLRNEQTKLAMANIRNREEANQRYDKLMTAQGLAGARLAPPNQRPVWLTDPTRERRAVIDQVSRSFDYTLGYKASPREQMMRDRSGMSRIQTQAEINQEAFDEAIGRVNRMVSQFGSVTNFQQEYAAYNKRRGWLGSGDIPRSDFVQYRATRFAEDLLSGYWIKHTAEGFFYDAPSGLIRGLGVAKAGIMSLADNVFAGRTSDWQWRSAEDDDLYRLGLAIDYARGRHFENDLFDDSYWRGGYRAVGQMLEMVAETALLPGVGLLKVLGTADDVLLGGVQAGGQAIGRTQALSAARQLIDDKGLQIFKDSRLRNQVTDSLSAAGFTRKEIAEVYRAMGAGSRNARFGITQARGARRAGYDAIERIGAAKGFADEATDAVSGFFRAQKVAYGKGVITGAPRFVGEGYERAKQMGATEPQAYAAAVMAMTASLFEGISDVFLFKSLARVQALDNVSNFRFSNRFAERARQITQTAGVQGLSEWLLEELPQGLTTGTAAYLGTNLNFSDPTLAGTWGSAKDYADFMINDFKKQLWETSPAFFAGAVMGFGTTVAGVMSAPPLKSINKPKYRVYAADTIRATMMRGEVADIVDPESGKEFVTDNKEYVAAVKQENQARNDMFDASSQLANGEISEADYAARESAYIAAKARADAITSLIFSGDPSTAATADNKQIIDVTTRAMIADAHMIKMGATRITPEEAGSEAVKKALSKNPNLSEEVQEEIRERAAVLTKIAPFNQRSLVLSGQLRNEPGLNAVYLQFAREAQQAREDQLALIKATWPDPQAFLNALAKGYDRVKQAYLKRTRDRIEQAQKQGPTTEEATGEGAQTIERQMRADSNAVATRVITYEAALAKLADPNLSDQERAEATRQVETLSRELGDIKTRLEEDLAFEKQRQKEQADSLDQLDDIDENGVSRHLSQDGASNEAQVRAQARISEAEARIKALEEQIAAANEVLDPNSTLNMMPYIQAEVQNILNELGMTRSQLEKWETEDGVSGMGLVLSIALGRVMSTTTTDAVKVEQLRIDLALDEEALIKLVQEIENGTAKRAGQTEEDMAAQAAQTLRDLQQAAREAETEAETDGEAGIEDAIPLAWDMLEGEYTDAAGRVYQYRYTIVKNASGAFEVQFEFRKRQDDGTYDDAGWRSANAGMPLTQDELAAFVESIEAAGFAINPDELTIDEQIDGIEKDERVNITRLVIGPQGDLVILEVRSRSGFQAIAKFSLTKEAETSVEAAETAETPAAEEAAQPTEAAPQQVPAPPGLQFVGFVSGIDDDGNITGISDTDNVGLALYVTKDGEYQLLPVGEDMVMPADFVADNDLKVLYTIPAKVAGKAARIVKPAIYTKVGSNYMLKTKGELGPLTERAARKTTTTTTTQTQEQPAAETKELTAQEKELADLKDKLEKLKAKPIKPTDTAKIKELRTRIAALKAEIAAASQAVKPAGKPDIVTMVMGVGADGRTVAPENSQEKEVTSLAVVRNPETGQLELTVILDTAIRKNRTNNSAQSMLSGAFTLALTFEQFNDVFLNGKMVIKNAILRDNGDGTYTVVEKGSITIAGAQADTKALESEVSQLEQDLAALEKEAQTKAEQKRAKDIADLETAIQAAEQAAQPAEEVAEEKPKRKRATKKAKEEAVVEQETEQVVEEKAEEKKPKKAPKTAKGKAKEAEVQQETEAEQEVVEEKVETPKKGRKKKPEVLERRTNDGELIEQLDELYTKVGQLVTVILFKEDGTVLVEMETATGETQFLTMKPSDLYAQKPSKGKKEKPSKMITESTYALLRRIHRLQLAFIPSHIAKIKAEDTTVGIALNSEAADFMQRAVNEIFNDSGAFEGVFMRGTLADKDGKNGASNTSRLISGLLGYANAYEQEGQFAAAEAIRNFVQVISEARGASGAVSFFVSSKSILHERLHNLSYILGAQRSFKGRHTEEGWKTLTSHPALLKAWQNYYAEATGQDPDSPPPANKLGDLVEEMAVYFADGMYKQFGVTKREAANYLNAWFTSFADRLGDDGDLALDRFIKEVRFGRDVIKQVKAARKAERERAEYSEANQSVRQVESGEAESTRGRVAEVTEAADIDEGPSMMRRMGNETPSKPSGLTRSVAARRGIQLAAQSYVTVRYADVQNAVQETLDKGLAEATDDFMVQAASRNPDRGYAFALGLALMELYDARGQHDVVQALQNIMSPWATEMGQALAIWGKAIQSSPLNATNRFKKTFKRLTGKEMDPEMEKRLLAAAERIAEANAEAAVFEELIQMLKDDAIKARAEAENLEETIETMDDPIEDTLEDVTPEKIAETVKDALKKQRPYRARVISKATIEDLKKTDKDRRARIAAKFGAKRSGERAASRWRANKDSEVNAAVERLMNRVNDAMKNQNPTDDDGPSFMLKNAGHGGPIGIETKGGLKTSLGGTTAGLVSGWGIYVGETLLGIATTYMRIAFEKAQLNVFSRFESAMAKALHDIFDVAIFAGGVREPLSRTFASIERNDPPRDAEANGRLAAAALIIHLVRMQMAEYMSSWQQNSQSAYESAVFIAELAKGRVKGFDDLPDVVRRPVLATFSKILREALWTDDTLQQRPFSIADQDPVLTRALKDDTVMDYLRNLLRNRGIRLENPNEFNDQEFAIVLDLFDSIFSQVTLDPTIPRLQSDALTRDLPSALNEYKVQAAIYDVTINATQDQFIDFHKSWDQQSDYVLEKLKGDPFFNDWLTLSRDEKPTREGRYRPNWDTEKTGMDNFYFYLADRIWGRPTDIDSKQVAVYMLASMYLSSLGIKGHFIESGVSGNNHYVVFDQSDVAIFGIQEFTTTSEFFQRINRSEAFSAVGRAANAWNAFDVQLATRADRQLDTPVSAPSTKAKADLVRKSVTERLAQKLAPLAGDELLEELRKPDEAEGPSKMIIGREAAQRLKESTDADLQRILRETNLARTLDLFPMATRMQTEGVEPDKIWLATGWYQGTDGKWRMELPDAQLAPGAYRLKSGDTHWLTDILVDNDFKRLLFAAYPALRTVLVEVLPLNKGNYGGWWNAGEAKIGVKAVDAETATSVLVHELQHFAQGEEGFVNGAAVEGITAAKRRLKRRTARYDDATKLYKSVIKILKDTDKVNRLLLSGATTTFIVPQTFNIWHSLPEESAVPLSQAPMPYVYTRNGKHMIDLTVTEMNQFAEMYEKNKDALADQRDFLADGQYYNVDKKGWTNAFDQYLATAGEVEARNAQARNSFKRMIQIYLEKFAQDPENVREVAAILKEEHVRGPMRLRVAASVVMALKGEIGLLIDAIEKRILAGETLPAGSPKNLTRYVRDLNSFLQDVSMWTNSVPEDFSMTMLPDTDSMEVAIPHPFRSMELIPEDMLSDVPKTLRVTVPAISTMVAAAHWFQFSKTTSMEAMRAALPPAATQEMAADKQIIWNEDPAEHRSKSLDKWNEHWLTFKVENRPEQFWGIFDIVVSQDGLDAGGPVQDPRRASAKQYTRMLVYESGNAAQPYEVHDLATNTKTQFGSLEQALLYGERVRVHGAVVSKNVTTPASDPFDAMSEGPSFMAKKTLSDEERKSVRLKQLERLIPESERMAKPIRKGKVVTMTDGRPFTDVNLAGLGGVDISDEALQRIFKEAYEKSGKAAKAAFKKLQKKGLNPNTAEFWNVALGLPNRARYWYELSSEAFVRLFPDLTKEERVLLIDMIAATSPLSDPNVNIRRAVSVLAEYWQGIPIETDIISEGGVTNALQGSVEDLKTGSFANTMLFTLGYTDRVPMSTNDRQVAATFGITGDDIAKNDAIYEFLSRFYIGLRDEINSKLPEGAEPYETWQLQALGWVAQRNITEPFRKNDDYLMALEEVIIPQLRAAGILDGDVITKAALLDPRTPDVLSRTRELFQKAPRLTLTQLEPTSPVVKEAMERAKKAYETGDLNALYKGAASYRNILRKTSSQLKSKYKKKDSILDLLLTALLGKSAQISRSRMATQVVGGIAIPQLNVPLSSVQDDLQPVLATLIASAMGQEYATWTKLTPAEFDQPPAEGTKRTVSVFTEQIFAPDSDVFGRFEQATGYDLTAVPFPNGTRFDVIPPAEGQVDFIRVENASSEILGEITSQAKDFAVEQLASVNYKQVLNNFKRELINEAVTTIWTKHRTKNDSITKAEIRGFVTAVVNESIRGMVTTTTKPESFSSKARQKSATTVATNLGTRLRGLARAVGGMELLAKRTQEELGLWNEDQQRKEDFAAKRIDKKENTKRTDSIKLRRKRLDGKYGTHVLSQSEGPSKMLANNNVDGSVTNIDYFGQELTGRLGSNKGGTYKGSDGRIRYVKIPQEPNQSRTEALSAVIYRLLGVPAPETVIFPHEGTIAFGSTIIPPGDFGPWIFDKELIDRFLDGFAADVLLANRDVVGGSGRNVIVNQDGTPVRIDNGGALLFRARGARKLEMDLDQLTELDQFFNGATNVYSHILSRAGINSLEDMKDRFIKQVADIVAVRDSYGGWNNVIQARMGMWNDADRTAVVNMLEARTKGLAAKARQMGGAAVLDARQAPQEIDTTMEGPSFMVNVPDDTDLGTSDQLDQGFFLTDEDFADLTDAMTLWLAENLPAGAGVDDFLDELGALTGDMLQPDDMYSVLAASVENVRKKRPPTSDEKKAVAAKRRELYKAADEWNQATSDANAGLVVDIMKDLQERAATWAAAVKKGEEALQSERERAEDIAEMLAHAVGDERRELEQELREVRKNIRALIADIERISSLRPPSLNLVQALVQVTQDPDILSAALIILIEGIQAANQWMARQGFDKEDAKRLLSAADAALVEAKAIVKKKSADKKEKAEISEEQYEQMQRDAKLRRRTRLAESKEDARALEEIRLTGFQRAVRALFDLRRANLLLHPRTWGINILSTLTNVLLDPLTKSVALLYDKLLAYRSGQRTTTVSLKANINGFLAIFRDDDVLRNLDKESGIRMAWHIMQHGADEDVLQSLQLSESNLQLAVNNVAAKGAAAMIDVFININFRFLGAQDALFKVFVFRKALEELAIVQALNNHPGVKGKELEKWKAYYLANPTEAMVQLAKEESLELTYQNSNIISQGLANLREGLQARYGTAGFLIAEATKIPIPFDRTPTNLIIQTLEYLPLSSWIMASYHFYRFLKATNTEADRTATDRERTKKTRAEYFERFGESIRLDAATMIGWDKMTKAEQAGLLAEELDKLISADAQRKFARVAGRSTVGSAIFTLGVFLGYIGLLAGFDQPEEDDPEEAEDFWERQALGIGPRSFGGFFNLPDTPLFTTMLIGGTIGNAIRRQEPKTVGEAVFTGVAALGENYSEFIYTHPVLQAMREFESKGSNTWGATFGMNTMTFLPGSRIIDSIGNLTDPIPRRRMGLGKEEGDVPFFSAFGRDYTNAIQTRLPYFREGVEEQTRKPRTDFNKSLGSRILSEMSPLKINLDPKYKWRRGSRPFVPSAGAGPTTPGAPATTATPAAPRPLLPSRRAATPQATPEEND